MNDKVEYNVFIQILTTSNIPKDVNELVQECLKDINSDPCYYNPGFVQTKTHMYDVYIQRLNMSKEGVTKTYSNEITIQWESCRNTLDCYTEKNLYFCNVHSNTFNYFFFININKEELISAFKIPSRQNIKEYEKLLEHYREKNHTVSSIKLNKGVPE